jgi:arginyl-tRNA synthetase
VITAELRRAILAAAWPPPSTCLCASTAEPLLCPGPGPGSYASSLPFRLASPGRDPRAAAAGMAARLKAQPWIAAAQATGPGYLTVTVARHALAGLAVRIAQAGAACTASDALRGRTVTGPAEVDLAAEPDWPQARAALAAHLTARLAAAAGAAVILSPERTVVPPPGPLPPLPAEPVHGPTAASPPTPLPVAKAVEYAGEDAVRFALARMPGGAVSASTVSASPVSASTVSASPVSASPVSASPVSASPVSASPVSASRVAASPVAVSTGPEPAVIARHVLENPAYAVRYAHAAAAAVLRWAAELGTEPAGPDGFRPRLLAEPGELALLDALSWLPERVAMAARRGRPDEFAGYMEELAARTIDTISTTGFTKVSGISSERLWLAAAARTGLAAGLGLLGVSAPARL